MPPSPAERVGARVWGGSAQTSNLPNLVITAKQLEISKKAPCDSIDIICFVCKR